MEVLLYTILTLCALGVLSAVILYFVAQKFRVEEDPRIEGQERLVIVAHGGTQMAALERFGVPRRSFPDWCGPNAGGYVLDTRDWPEQHILHLVETVQYTRENG